MFKSLKQFYNEKIRPETEGVSSIEVNERSLRLATAALLIEVTRADNKTKEEEILMVISALRETFEISKEETTELIHMANEESDGSVSVYQFTHLIDKGFTYDQKSRIIELLWRVVYADNEMEKHEEYTVRKIAGLLHITHNDYIKTKHKARDEVVKKS